MGSLAQTQPADVHFERIGSEAGLSHNTVNAIIEDRDGFLWIATDDGLDRYDGYAFVVFRLEASGETLETSNTFRALLEDAAGHLWAGADQGLYRLERATGRFLAYPLPRENARGPRGVSTLFEDRRGTVWVGAGNELFFYEADRDAFAALPLDHAPSEGPEARFMAIQQDAEGMIWALLIEGRPFRLSLYQIDPVTLASQRHELSREQTSDALLIDREGRFWIHPTNQGVVAPEDLLFPRSESAPRVSFIESIIQDDEGAIWFATEAGLYRRDPATQALSLHLPDPTQSNWQRNYLRGLHLDASGILWMGSLDGLLRYDPHVKRFRRLRHDAQNPVSLSSDPVSAIVAGPDGNLWVSTFGGGLNRLDLATKAVERFRHDDRRPGSLCDDHLWDLTWSRDGLLWIATNSGLCVYDPRQGRFSRVAVSGLGQESGLYGLKTVDEHPDGTLWLGTNEGIFRYDPRQGSTRYYGHEKEGGGLRSRVVMSLVVEDAQTVWMGSSLGDLHRLDVEKEGIDAFPLRTTDGRAASEVEIYDLHLGRQGTLWLATSAGLGRFNLADESFEFPIAAEEFPGSVVYSILEDDRGGLWLGTNQGLSHFDPERPTGERVRTFTLSDGVGNVEFNRHAAFKHEDGTLFFGGMTGLTFFHDDDIRDNAYVPPVVLTRIQASNRDDTETINPFGLDQLVLSYRDYFFSFEFTALNFTNPERNQYAYQLEGFDEDWVEAGSRRFASYTNIPPGNYVFRVKGSNNDGVWNEDGTSLRLTITPPWWGMWWFRLLALAAVAGLLAAAYRYRVARLLERERLHQTEEEARRLAELDAAKSRFFANISHEFRTPLTLILGTLDQMEDAAAPKQPAQRIRRNAHRLLGLIDQLLDLSKLEAGKLQLDPRPGDLVAHLRRLVRSFQPLAERNRINLQLRTEQEALPGAFDAEKIATVVGNLLSNALKFTPEGGKVLVTLDQRAEENRSLAEIVVKDTGPGIPKEALPRIFDRFEQVDDSPTRREQSGTGIGLALAKELVELHGGAILVESEVGFGSAFIVRLPLAAVESEKGGEGEREKGRKGEREIAWQDEHVEALPVERDAPPTPPYAHTPTLLIVEDNAEVRALVRGHLEAEYHVLEAADGEAGLAMAREAQPDLVISDVMMPRMDGYALCRALKADDALRTVPVVLLTARASDEDAVAGLEAGADDYITKPFHAAVLRAKIANLIAARRQMRERFSKELVVKPADVVVSSDEEAFLQSILSVIEERLGDSTFGVEVLAQEVGLSRRQLERRLREVTGQAPAEVIRQMRLERASQLLKAGAGSVSEIAYAVGYKSPNYFSTAFREAFGHSPSEHFDSAS